MLHWNRYDNIDASPPVARHSALLSEEMLITRVNLEVCLELGFTPAGLQSDLRGWPAAWQGRMRFKSRPAKLR
jgi:hypothetical protein